MKLAESEYVESPQRLECEFLEALERNRQPLDEQRSRIKREAAVQFIRTVIENPAPYEVASR